MAAISFTSSLASSANNIVSLNSKSKPSLVRAKIEYKKFGDFIETKKMELERIPLPENKKIQKLANINVVNTFGSAGGLLRGLLGGSLDLGGLVSGFFPGENTKVGTSPKTGKPSAKPALKGGKLRMSGLRALGVTNALFAGLDFATGLAEGESVGKSAAGTAGSLAGSLLGGAIGQTLIPIPGVGFVIGRAAGSFLGGFGADRAYDTATSQRFLISKQEAKLKEQKDAQEKLKRGRVEKQNDLLSKFGDVAGKFEGFVKGILGGVIGAIISGVSPKDMPNEWGVEYPDSTSRNDSSGEYLNVDVSGGIDPSTITPSSGYGWRWGRMHKGTDYGMNEGTPITLIQPGIVEYSGWAGGGAGNSIYINHPDGTKTVYFHLSKPSPLKAGQQINPGTVIGQVGMSGGTSTGPHLHFEYYPAGSSTQIDSREYASKYFRFGGNVKVKPKGGAQSATSAQPMVQTGVRPGQITSTAFGMQGSTSTINYGNATKTNIKGFILVPGHITGGGASGEIAATQKIAKNIVDKLQKKYPGVPIRFWNNRNYPQTDAGFARQMNDLKKLENQGWEIIEIHMDASIESGQGKGRGVIVPFDGKNLNEFDVRFAAQKGSFDPKHRDGLAATNRGMTIVETGNIGPQALKALNRGDQSAVDFFSSDTIQVLEQLIKEGKIGGGYRAVPQNITTPSPRNLNINQQLSYNSRANTGTVVINRPSTIIADSGGGQSKPTVIPSSSSGNGGGIVVIASSGHDIEKGVLNKLQELYYT